jgi:hypothetical protein
VELTTTIKKKKMTDRIYYTYAYLREDGTPYYIGRGKEGRAFATHKISRPSRDRILFLKKDLTFAESVNHERYMIFVLGRKDLGTGILRNLTDGGEGVTNLALEAKRKISEKRKGQVNRTGPHTPEARAKMSASHSGKVLSQDHKDNIAKAMKGRTLSESTREKLKKSRSRQTPPTLGQKRTSEQKAKMSEAAKLRWAKQKQEV